MSVGVGQLLKLLDMVPDKKGKRTFIEKLPSAQKIDGGNLSSLMAKLQSGGIEGLFKDPLSSIIGPLQQLLSAVMGAQGGGSGGGTGGGSGGGAGNPFAAAIGGPGGMMDAVQALSEASARLSGVAAPAAGQYGFVDLALHESVLDQFGGAIPPALAIDVAGGPLLAGDLLSQAAADVYSLNIAVVLGQIAPSVAAPKIIEYTNKINAILSSSNDAISQGEEMAPGISQVQTAAGLLVSGSPSLKKLIRMCLQPSSAAAMDAAMSDRLTIRPPDTAAPAPDPNQSTTCY